MDISDIWPLHNMRISQDLILLWDSIKATRSEKFPPWNREILKPIPPTTTRQPASIQDHKSYFHCLWDDSEFVMAIFFGAITGRVSLQNSLDRKNSSADLGRAYQQQIHFRTHLLCQTRRSGGVHKRPGKAFLVPIGHKQTDRGV